MLFECFLQYGRIFFKGLGFNLLLKMMKPKCQKFVQLASSSS
jgi:hypothetical protein